MASLGVLWLLLAACCSGCGANPERLLTGRWQEATWEYERLDAPRDGASELTRQRDRRIVRHAAEYWEFLPDGVLVISTRDGRLLRRRWRLKGRGNVLTISADEPGSLEVYDIKKLNQDELVLHYDIGMEVRGIARLSFRNLPKRATVNERSAGRPEA